ncbi:hypothetical protein [Maioricimonas sp. JC845]|uniref:hypothetical protein n=1 Tax=Maioricimonas sp. JC845 TaxID=3232138 RepID=UPI00345823E1
MIAEQSKEQAKDIIVEIVRQAGGMLRNKTNLFKAFWRAHVAYAATTGRNLTEWPIVRMPNGPGIDKFHVLLGELVSAEVLAADQVEYNHGRSWGFVFRLVSDACPEMGAEAAEAVAQGVQYVDGKRAATVSEASHFHSRAWARAAEGAELDVFLDAMSPDEFEQMKAEATSRRKRLERAISCDVPPAS